MMNFCITGLPRSRTAWFAAYFTASGHLCAHEGMRGCNSVSEYYKKMEDYEGDSNCGAVLINCKKTVIIERDPTEVKNSLYNLFGNTIAVDNTIDFFYEKLKHKDGLRIKFSEIDDNLKLIHEYCVGDTYNENIAEMMKKLNITTNDYAVDEKSTKLLGELLCLS